MTLPPQQTPAPTCVVCEHAQASHMKRSHCAPYCIECIGPMHYHAFRFSAESPTPPTPVAGETPGPSVASMRGILKGFTRCGPESDAERIEWLEARGVVSISFRDGSQLSPGGGSFRAIVDSAAELDRATRGAGAEP